MEGITYIDRFIDNQQVLFEYLKNESDWDESMAARKTMSFGKPYNYSQITYPERAFPPEIQILINQVESYLDFEPNNCLINYYVDGKSKMGFHSDQTDILAENTGVVIISLGATRTLRFRQIADKSIIKDFPLLPGSLIYMSQDLQKEWQHAIPKSDTQESRMSLTFRKIK